MRNAFVWWSSHVNPVSNKEKKNENDSPSVPRNAVSPLYYTSANRKSGFLSSVASHVNVPNLGPKCVNLCVQSERSVRPSYPDDVLISDNPMPTPFHPP